MLLDGRSVPTGTKLSSDVCIVGAGPAGITLARALSRQGFKVLVLESGGSEEEARTQSLTRGRNTGYPYYPLHWARFRALGGSSVRWSDGSGPRLPGSDGLKCAPLEESDFQSRSWVPDSGWPFGLAEMLPYYQLAQADCGLGPFSYSADDWVDEQNPTLDLVDGVRNTVSQHASRTVFRDYEAEIGGDKNIELYSHSNLVGMETSGDRQSIASLRVRCLETGEFSVSAQAYVLAAGGIENARLLLLAAQEEPGLPMERDIVGRFFMEHLHVYTGVLVPASRSLVGWLGFYSLHQSRGVAVSGGLMFSDDLARDEGLLNLSIQPVPSDRALASAGGASIAALFWGVHNRRMPADIGAHLRNVAREMPLALSYAYRQVSKSYPTDLSLVRLLFQVEQRPIPESRVTLANERDELGQRQVVLDWRISEQERYTIRRAQDILDAELRRSGAGRVVRKLGDTRPEPLFWGHRHHMGTTRMHVDPRRGVVDPDSKVHSLANLFIAGSSVFPTGGQANPTLTIVALARRLADHLGAVLRPQRIGG